MTNRRRVRYGYRRGPRRYPWRREGHRAAAVSGRCPAVRPGGPPSAH